MPHAIILLSGGLDSATVLAIARRDGFTCHTLAFDYGQRHRHELAAAELVSHAGGAADHRVVAIDLRAIGGSALTADIDVPKHASSPSLRERAGGGVPVHPNLNEPPTPIRNASSIPITYVPARNLTFLSIAVGFAEAIGGSDGSAGVRGPGAHDIFIGVNAIDYSGYPDCRPEFIEAFERAANLGTKAGVESSHANRIRVHAPLAHLSKAQIITLGTSLGVDYALTHSCYDPLPWHGRPVRDSSSSSSVSSSIPIALACGRCDSCVLRRDGFQAAGIPDPTRYAKEPLA